MQGTGDDIILIFCHVEALLTPWKKLLSIQQNINERNVEFEQLKETRGCPVCKIGEEFQGGDHCCKICQQFIHPWCGKSKEEGSGKEITCKNCS